MRYHQGMEVACEAAYERLLASVNQLRADAEEWSHLNVLLIGDDRYVRRSGVGEILVAIDNMGEDEE